MDGTRARHISDGLVEAFGPWCERLEIAGSVRREVPRVGDLELVAIPKVEEYPADLFGESTVRRNLLHGRITELSDDLTRIRPIKPPAGTKAPHRDWPTDNRWESKASTDSRYWRLYIPRHDLKVDLFLCKPETWGCIFTIRTGSAEFSAALVQHWTRTTDGHFLDGRLYPAAVVGGRAVRVHPKTGTRLAAPLETPEERDVFAQVGVEWVEPAKRFPFIRPATVRAGRRQGFSAPGQEPRASAPASCSDRCGVEG